MKKMRINQLWRFGAHGHRIGESLEDLNGLPNDVPLLALTVDGLGLGEGSGISELAQRVVGCRLSDIEGVLNQLGGHRWLTE